MTTDAPNPHLSTEVQHLGADPADASVVVVAVHGRNHSPAYMVEHLVDPLRAELRRGDPETADEIAWILPAAHGGSWYPNGFLAPLTENQPWLDHALDVMARLDDTLADRDPATVLWCGFSQGACLVTEHLARHPTRDGARRGGLAALTGGMIGPSDSPLVVHGSFDGMPAYFGVGDPDDWVPTWRVHESAEAYRAAGADVSVEVFPGRPHEIGRIELDRVLAMVRTVAGT